MCLFESRTNRIILQDMLASDMYSVISKEAVLANLLLEYVKLQQASHLSALNILERFLPDIQSTIGNLKITS